MWSVFFVFLSYLDRNVVRGDFLSRALDAEKESKEMFSMINGTFCAKMSLIGQNILYQVSDGAEVVRTVVSPAGKLVNCSVVVNQMEVKSFMHECRLGLKEQRAPRQLDTPFTRMDEARMICQGLKERSERSRVRKDPSQDSSQEDKVLKRSKRGFTYPGTLWCGAGNMADNFNQLGEFAETDSCCRIHDHCPSVIHAFSSNYGYTNFKWHSICHCDCDNALKACLRKVNDTSSRVVGQAFFNVIGVPCFELVYEERCAERHWYGLCKRYDKLPIAVLREAVPYDYGGIDVIDELTLAPPKRKDSKKMNEEEQPESVTQSTMSSPEEPSLRNVVTAAEDFIKVLATVSTSQSSSSDSNKDEAQSSEKKKKKKKNTGKKKKTNKKQKGKEKGRKRKQKSEAGVKTEEGATVPPPGSKAEEVLSLSNFIRESNTLDRSSSNANRADDRELELRRKDEPSNEVMKDEPATGKESVSITPPLTVQKGPAESEMMKEEITLPLSPPATAHLTKNRGQIKCKRKKIKTTLPPSSENTIISTITNFTPTAQPEQYSFTEQQLLLSTASSPDSTPKVKKNRSKERGDKEGRKKRKKSSSDAPIVSADQSNSSEDSLKVIPPNDVPTMSSVPTSDQQLSHRPYIYRQNSQTTALTFAVLKRQKSKERALRNRNRRRKTAGPPSSENLLFSHSSSENVASVLTTPHPLIQPANAQEAETHSEWERFTTAAPTVISTLRWDPSRQQRNPKQTEPVTLATSRFNAAAVKELRSEEPWMSTSAAMSPLQLSVERAKAQFNRKKRRKALNRQQ